MNTLSITVDIEDWYHIPSVTGSPFSVYKDVDEFFKKWKGRYDYLSNPTRRVLDLLDDFDVKATFFVVADVVEHYPGLLESIAEQGHEVGCHRFSLFFLKEFFSSLFTWYHRWVGEKRT